MEKSTLFSLFIFIVTLNLSKCYDIEKFSILMPNVSPNAPELYLCTPVKIDTDNTYYIVGFEPNATMNTAHHILLYGCSEPGSAKPLWNCGEMASSNDSSNKYEVASTCASDAEIVYAWARDAPPLNLPDGVGFKVGKNSKIKYLVMQVHYAVVDQFMDGSTDDSGITLHLTKQPLTKLAGVYILGTGGSIAPHSVEHMESSCKLKEHKTLHPFAYRTHTHSLGRVVAGYVIKNDHEWIELGKRDPLTPQMFYKTHYNGTISRGDKLAARCTMQSERTRWTYTGSTNKDEMCNFYLMYYVENTTPLNDGYCFTAGPPVYSWRSAGLTNIPDKEASTV